MSYSLNSLKGAIYGNIYGTTIGVIKGDTRSLDYSSYYLNIYPIVAISILFSILKILPQHYPNMILLGFVCFFEVFGVDLRTVVVGGRA